MSWFSNISAYGPHQEDHGEDHGHSEDSSLEDEEEEEATSWSYEVPAVNMEELMHKCMDDRSKQTQPIAVLESACKIVMQEPRQATCSQFSPDGSLIAIGLTNGYIEIHSVLDGSLVLQLDALKGGKKRRWPCTCLCIRPCKPGESSYNVMLSCDLNGRIHYWHMTSGMHLGVSEEEGNNILAIDFHEKGSKYATGGSDCKIRVYDAATRRLTASLSEGNGTSTSGHSNRVFAVKFYPLDDNIVLSGGWDNTVQVWDMRACHSVRSIWGPRICGDALDVDHTGSLILTGSWRNSNQLQPCRVYVAKYGKDVSKNMIFAGGSLSNEACVFFQENLRIRASLPRSKKAIHSMVFSSTGNLWSVTSPDVVNVVDLNQIKRL